MARSGLTRSLPGRQPALLLLGAALCLLARPARGEVQCEDGSRLYVALALSGGGLRAATFSHGVIESLRSAQFPAGLQGAHGRDILDNLDVISAVSGGSLAAGYYAAAPRAASEPFLTAIATARLGAQLMPGVFARGWGDINWNFFIGPWHKNLQGWRGLATQAMVQKVFGNLVDPHALLGTAGNARLLINTTNLTTLKSFVLPDDLPCLGITAPGFKLLAAASASSALPGLMEPLELHHDPAEISRLKTAGAYPAVCRDRVSETPSTAMLSDGGVVDNLGLSAIIRDIARRKRTEPSLRAVIIMVNANTESPAAAVPADLKDSMIASFSRLIDTRSADTVEVVRDFLKDYGVDLVQLSRTDLLGLLSNEDMDTFDNWALGADVDSARVHRVYEAVRAAVKNRTAEINGVLDNRCASSLRPVAADTDASVSTNRTFLTWFPEWTEGDDYILSTISKTAYRVSAESREALRLLRLDRNKLADNLKTESDRALKLEQSLADLETRRAADAQTRDSRIHDLESAKAALEKVAAVTGSEYARVVSQLKELDDKSKEQTTLLRTLTAQLGDTRAVLDGLRQATVTVTTPPLPAITPAATHRAIHPAVQAEALPAEARPK